MGAADDGDASVQWSDIHTGAGEERCGLRVRESSPTARPSTEACSAWHLGFS